MITKVKKNSIRNKNVHEVLTLWENVCMFSVHVIVNGVCDVSLLTHNFSLTENLDSAQLFELSPLGGGENQYLQLYYLGCGFFSHYFI